ncbi:MAG: hypothetical protein Q8Q35_02620 [Nanoarchaeota archaeon]|nr:hypothetical protein [Nanoarchaeota archaeon]
MKKSKSNKNLILVLTIALTFMAIILSSIYLGNTNLTTSAVLDICNYGYTPGSENWIITEKVVCKNEDFVVDGNIIIKDGGSLELDNTKLSLNVKPGTTQKIWVKPNADSLILKDSIITSTTGLKYLFMVNDGPNLYITNSQIEYVGNPNISKDSGLLIQTNSVIINGLSILNSELGIIIDSPDIIIKNLLMDNISKDGIVILNGGETIFENCDLSNIGNKDLKVVLGNNDIHLLSCNFNKTNVLVLNETSQVNYEWFVDILVQNDSIPVSSAFVNISNKYNISIAQGYTNEEGYLNHVIILEKKQFSSNSEYFNPYSFYATKSGLVSDTPFTITFDYLVVLNLGQTGGEI